MVDEGEEGGTEELEFLWFGVVVDGLVIDDLDEFLGVLGLDEVDASELFLENLVDQYIGFLVVLHVLDEIDVVLDLDVVERELSVLLFDHLV